ncbi:MAG: hypothetical protein ACI8P9_004676 [Parasphingorhabdus sp.]|jgi:hypothetical protein
MFYQVIAVDFWFGLVEMLRQWCNSVERVNCGANQNTLVDKGNAGKEPVINIIYLRFDGLRFRPTLSKLSNRCLIYFNA